ncbi:MAG: N-acetylglucosamine-6-phosphate deacetylase [Anaerolineaceae bacterium]|nr:N-acetylglucosamine-6-phosphate deacetylase [Anaerolineaceae bacterium]
MNTILSVSQLITTNEVIKNGILAWDADGKIIYCGPPEGASQISGDQIDLTNYTASPGLINIHVHGGKGISFGFGNLEEELVEYSRWVAGNGVTGFILTLTGPNPDFIRNTIQAYVPLLEKDYPGAQPLGLHLEGPFINPEKNGAYNPDWIRPPSVDEMRMYIDAGKGWIKHVTLAPELENAQEVAELLHENGIHPALGHSNTDYETAHRALNGLFDHVTHTFNAQSTFHHRKPGVVGAILSSNKGTAELITDPAHVYPPAMKILFRCLGVERIVIITDAMPGAGLPDGTYKLLGREAVVKNGTALFPDGRLAGSTATMDGCIRTMVNLVEVSLQDALYMATHNPAVVIGHSDHIGSLSPGMDADVAIFDPNLHVKMTFRKGKPIFEDTGNGQ